MHASAWPLGSGRPQLNQTVSFEVDLGPKRKRAKNVQLLRARAMTQPTKRASRARWGGATLFAIPAFLLLYVAIAILWNTPLWVAGLYLAASTATFIAYTVDKTAATRRSRRTPESRLHALSLIGGWPGALLAQQLLRHKFTKQAFRQAFWGTVLLNVITLLLLASPLR